MQKKLYLIDAFALIFRAYYSMIRNPRMTSYGKNTNAQYGFTNSLIDLLNREKPSHIAVCFDSPGDTERNEIYSEYKANREETPEDLLKAIPDIKQIIEAFNIPIVELPGYEADDIIGGLAKQAEMRDFDTFMVTPDKDFGQLVSDHIFMYVPAARGNGPQKMGPQEICDKWDIKRVDQVIDILGLMGDASDNIPGIKGVGEKTAVKLLKEYDNLENVLANAVNIKGKLGEKVRDGKEDALMSKQLATIITDIPYSMDENKFIYEEPDKDKLDEIFQSLEFRTLGKRLLGDSFSIENTQSTPSQNLFDHIEEDIEPENIELKSLIDFKVKYTLIDDIDTLTETLNYISEFEKIAFDTETDGLDLMESKPVGLSISVKPFEAFYINLSDRLEEFMVPLQKFFSDSSKLWIGQNLKFDKHMLENIGIKVEGNVYDTLLAHYVHDSSSKHGLDFLAQKYLHYKTIPIEKLLGPKGKNQKNMRDIPDETIKNYACEDADVTLRLYQKFKEIINDEKEKAIIEDVEFPTSDILQDMETTGVRLDSQFLHNYSHEIEIEILNTEKAIYAHAGETFNISSPKQLGNILFENMQLSDKPKKTKSGQYKTGESELIILKDVHPIIEEILNYRQLTKLKSTYVDALPRMVNPRTHRIHTTYSQSIAVTGRLSSNNPNLQNIPIKTERGKKIREAFIPSHDCALLSADYSQIELRVIAYVSDDRTMIEAFREDKDIHTATASKVFGVSESEVSPEMRYKAKAVNFGIIYGQTPFGLSQSLKIPRNEARTIIDNYFKEFPRIKNYMDDTIASAERNGYVSTLIGRKRYLADINSTNKTVKGFAERNAINSPIQGSAADLIKIAMIRVNEKIHAQKMQSKLILQVHDELVFDAKNEELNDLKTLVKHEMENAQKLGDVPLKVSIGIGSNWLEAH